MKARLLALSVTILLVPSAPAGQAERPDASVLNRMHAYLRAYESDLSSVVAEERFDQKFVSIRTRKISLGTQARARRTIESDVSFMRLPGGREWLGFRDVRKVDGQALRDSGVRVAQLLERGGDVLEQARAISAAGAAHNLGLPRTINVPTAVLEILHPSHRARFRYRMAGSETLRKAPVTILAFEEIARPTVVRQPDGGNILSSGRAWVESTTGRILRVEWFYDSEPAEPGLAVRPRLLVDFEPDAKLGFLVPTRMEETFGVPYETGDGIATYRTFRRFRTGARIVPQ